MIEAEKLTKRYGPVTAVGGRTFAARPGHVTSFPGPERRRQGFSLIAACAAPRGHRAS